MKARTIAAACVLALAPAVALAQKVSYDYDKAANFAGYKTFALKDGTKVGNPLVDDRIVSALEAELTKKGLVKSEANPDVSVVYHIAFDKQKDITAWNTGGGPYGWRWGGMGTTDVRVNEILIGTMVIDMADSAKGALVWRGMGTKQVDPQANPERRDKNITEAVEKILKNYPPKKR
jgi:hypothetical protein